jgi:glucose/arabinose dehydrogenase
MAVPGWVAPPQSSGARTLYLNHSQSSDSGNGLTPTTAKRTVAGAISAATSGDIIIVDERGGDFSETIGTISKDFSTTNPVTFRARNWNTTTNRVEGARPRITSSFSYSSATGYRWQGIDFAGNNSTSSGQMQGIFYLSGTSYISYDGCLIHGFRGGVHGNGQAMLLKEDSHHIWFGNGQIYDIGKHIGHDHCVYLQKGHHAWFWNSVLRDSQGFGLHWFGSFDDVWCKYLTIVHNRSSGITIGGRPGDSTRGPDAAGNYWPDRLLIEDCIITHHDDSSTGGEIHDPGWAATSFNNDGSEVVSRNWVTFNNARGSLSGVSVSNLVLSDPRYVNYASRDLRIQSGSPAQAKATRHSVITFDINGNPRNSTTSYGAYRGADETGTTGPGPGPDPVPTIAAPTGIIGKPFNGGITVEWNSGISNPGNTTNVSSSLVSQGTSSFPIALGAWKNDTEDRQYVLERTGKCFVFKNGTKQTTPFIDVSSIVAPDGSGLGNEGGALSIAFHPNFGTSGNYRFYMGLVQKSNNTLYISEFQSSAANVEVGDITTRRDLVAVASSDSQGRHYGGCLRFGPDNALYATVGDMTQTDTAPQNDSNIRGKLIKFADPTTGSTTAGPDRGAYEFTTSNPPQWPNPAITGNQIYVSPSGSDSNNGSTPALAVRQLDRANALATPGTTINVAAGAYNACTLTTSGNSSARIRYVSTTKHGATITGTSTNVVAIRGTYIDFDGFDVSGGVNTWNCINIWGNTGIGDGYNNVGQVRVRGCRVHDTPRVCSPNGGIVIEEPDCTIEGCLVYNMGDQSLLESQCRLYHGIYTAHSRTRIANNVIYNVIGDGIESWHAATNLQIVNNTVYNCGGNGIIVGGTTTVNPSGNTNSFIANNICVNNRISGIKKTGTGSGHTYTNNLCRDNVEANMNVSGSGTETGTLTSDPLFVSTTNRDFTLQSGSPAINSGTTTNAPATDYLGITRTQTTGTSSYVHAAKGLRNPWKFDFDPGAAYTPGTLVPQDIYVGHVGEATAEAIWRIAGGTNTVRNAGWPNYEGNVLRSGYSAITYDQAIIVQTRANGYRSITGGTVVRDKYVTDQIKGKYIYSDYIKAGLRRADAVTGANDGAAGTLTGNQVASIDRDQFNRSYLLEHNSAGRIFRLKGAAQTPPQTGFARYRVFVNGTEQALTDPTSFVFTLGGLTNGATYAVEVLAEDSAGNRSTRTSINLTPGTTGGGTPPLTQNLALNKTATSSGNETTALVPGNAVDGNASTRWSSAKFQPTLQWWQVDLGSLQTIETIVINWEAFSPSYNIQTSTDGTNFVTRLAATSSGAGEVTHTLTPVQARYVRIADQQLNSVNTNTSFFEVEIYGASVAPPVDTIAPPAPTGLIMTALAGGWHATHSDNSKSASDFLKYVWYEDGVQLPGPSDPRSPTYQVTNRVAGRVYNIGVEAWDTQTTPNVSARTTAPVTPLTTTPGSGTTVALENPISSGPTINSPIQLTGRQSDLFDRFYVASRTDRKMWTVRTGVTQTTPFLDVSGIASNFGSQGGVLGFVIHPDLDTAGEIAAYFTWTDASGNWRLTEVKSTDGNFDVASLATRRDLLTLTSLDASGRNLGGGLRFDSNKALWVGIGDNYNGNTILSGSTLPIPQDETTPRGKIIKFPSPRTSTSWVIVAKGLRNPRRFAFDSGTQQINTALVPQSVYISDEGSDTSLTAIPRQEVNYIPGGTTSITNFDWPYREGTFQRSAAPTPTQPVPIVTTQAASTVGTTSITFTGTVDPENQSGSAFFQYGLSPTSLTSTTSSTNLSGTTATPVSVNQSGLLANTTYYYRLVYSYPTNLTVNGSTLSAQTLSTPSTPSTNPLDSVTLWTANSSMFLPAPLPVSTGSVVTANSGNWQSVVNAAADGTTIKLAAGDYTGTITKAASVSNPITLIPDGDNAVVRFNTALSFAGASGIRVRRCVLSPADDYGAGFLPNAQWIEISFCEYEGVDGGIPLRGGYYFGDATYPHHCYFVHNRVRSSDTNATRFPEGISNFAHGVYMGKGYNCVVANNLILPQPGWNLYVWGGFNDSYIGLNTCFAPSGRNSMTVGGNTTIGQPTNVRIHGNVFSQAIEEFQPGANVVASYNWGNEVVTAVSWTNPIGTGNAQILADGRPQSTSPLLNKVPNAGFKYDFYGKARPATNCAAGACETA